jgi:hypothetical protein
MVALGHFVARSATAFSQAQSWQPGELAAETIGERGEFIAAFSVGETRRDFVWPLKSLPPAPFNSVRMVVESMPRAWSEKRGDGPGDKASVPLTAYRCLQVNGHSLPKPPRVSDSSIQFRISLEQGRLRFTFLLPPGYKLDSRYALIRIKLYQMGKSKHFV